MRTATPTQTATAPTTLFLPALYRVALSQVEKVRPHMASCIFWLADANPLPKTRAATPTTISPAPTTYQPMPATSHLRANSQVPR